MSHWSQEAVFYHIYPLGFCGAPKVNDFIQPNFPRLDKIGAWLDHIQGLGANALYLGPVFESSKHGYDTADYYWVDRRLGSNATLAVLSKELHQRGMRLILDGVFNHVGRNFWAFRDLCQNGVHSPYKDWFSRVDFTQSSPFGDPFTYEGWNGHFELVRLNQHHPAVKEHLFEAVRAWVQAFDIDGLRLDAADCLEPDFIRDLSRYCRDLRPDFWLLGEVIHGDYRQWANADMLDSVTNYECYKGLYSSLADANYYEIAYALNRQFGSKGMYSGLPMYNFVDNHDVDRVTSKLAQPAHLYPLYLLLMTMPGVPSIYYGSEWGLAGQRTSTDDSGLRPCIDLPDMARSAPQPSLPGVISRLALIRKQHSALTMGSYTQMHVSHQQLAFCREYAQDMIVVALNAAQQTAAFDLNTTAPEGAVFIDVLNEDERFIVRGQKIRFAVPPTWGRILVRV